MPVEQFPPPGSAEARLPQSAHVLVVDDDPIVRRVIVTMLKAAGMTTDEASCGREGIDRLEEHAFDVVLSDVDMPDGNGLDVLRAVRRIDLDMPVLLVTGIPEVRTAAQALEYGAFRYLTKPIDFGALVNAIRLAARAHALARIRRDAATANGLHEQIASDRAGLEVRFDSALSQLWMAYQPILGARSGALFGVEALLRTDEASLPHPGAVIEAATRLGRLSELGRLTRTRAAETVADTSTGMFLFVNLHPDDLFDDDLVRADSALARIASRVVLEITERAALQSTPALLERLASLREMGFRLAIDDIGAGYSGLSSFADVMPEVVKIDMALVRGVHQSEIRQRTIRALCALCHDSGSLVVGEGVETVDERDCLFDLGCDLFQGYMFGRPTRDLPRWRSSDTLAAINATGLGTLPPPASG